MSFWDITSYVAEDFQIQFNFNRDAPDMAFIDPSKIIQGTIPAQQPLNAALWKVNTLNDYFDDAKDAMQVTLPAYYHKKEQGQTDSFKTGERGAIEKINLSNHNPYFYEVYQALEKLKSADQNAISGEIVSELMSKRGKRILSRTSYWTEEGKDEPMLNTYTRLESNLYRMSRQKREEYDAWMYNSR